MAIVESKDLGYRALKRKPRKGDFILENMENDTKHFDVLIDGKERLLFVGSRLDGDQVCIITKEEYLELLKQPAFVAMLRGTDDPEKQHPHITYKIGEVLRCQGWTPDNCPIEHPRGKQA